MITEDYVSFETAKLLNKKGFNERCYKKYNSNGDLFNSTEFTYGLMAPTLQMAMKWLREVHKLHIDVDPSEGDWNPTVLELENWTCVVKFGDKIPIQDSYEEAVKAAIKYCLTNLI